MTNGNRNHVVISIYLILSADFPEGREKPETYLSKYGVYWKNSLISFNKTIEQAPRKYTNYHHVACSLTITLGGSENQADSGTNCLVC